MDEDNLHVYERLIQKCYSIRGMRKLNHEFKLQRRHLLESNKELSNEYITLSQGYLTKLNILAEANTKLLLDKTEI